MSSNSDQQPELVRALQKLTNRDAIPVCSETTVPLPESHFVADHCLAKHIARTKESFAFVPDQGPWQTYGIFRSANVAWKHDKLPVLAVCAYSFSPGPFQRETGIQADTVDQFLTDLKLAHYKVTTLGASPAYVIRHHHNPSDQRDVPILPANANLVVYQPYALSSTQLAMLFNHVADVNGKLILCDNRSDFSVSHPHLSEAAERSIKNAVPPDFRKVLDRGDHHKEVPDDCLRNSEIAQQVAPSLGHVPHPMQRSHVTPPSVTNKYSIYHAKNPNDVTSPDNFELVAEIEADSIHRALSKAQDFGAPWTENPGVETRSNGMLRSTRPGDLIVHDGVAQRFDGYNFQQIDFTPEPRPPKIKL